MSICQAHNVMMPSLSTQNYILMSFWCNNRVIITILRNYRVSCDDTQYVLPSVYLCLSRASANEGRRYIWNAFFHWLRHCSATNRKQALAYRRICFAVCVLYLRIPMLVAVFKCSMQVVDSVFFQVSHIFNDSRSPLCHSKWPMRTGEISRYLKC